MPQYYKSPSSKNSENLCRKNTRDNPTPASLHKKDGAQRLGGESQSHPFFVVC